MTEPEQIQSLPPIENRIRPDCLSTSPLPVHEAPVTAAGAPPPGLPLAANLPAPVRSKSRGIAWAIRSGVQYAIVLARSDAAACPVSRAPTAAGKASVRIRIETAAAKR